jgi:hypothetical protein
MSTEARISTLVLLLAGALLAAPQPAAAAPAHDICEDLGGSVPFGISSFSVADDWLVEAHDAYGVDWGFVYVYLVPPDPAALDDYASFIGEKHAVAVSVGAVPVFTFYQLLQIGQNAGVTGASEAEIVRQVLADPDLMRTYFDNFVFVLETLAALDPPSLLHVEPDSFGFMMWAMGVEGNDDATSIAVQVAGSGHPDLGAFADNASGFGHALVALRDAYAPEVRLGWHASNFRAGQFPEVVTGFYGAMGDWDVLVSEHPHLEPDELAWWDPWDEAALETNLAWCDAVTSAAGVPILLWQLPIGTVDWHLLGDVDDLSLLTRFTEAGVAGFLFEHQDFTGAGDPDLFRASGDLGAVPPGTSGAGGTAADMRARLADYSTSPLGWPDGGMCESDAGADGGPDIDLSGTAKGCNCSAAGGASSSSLLSSIF